jgi:RNA polymerase sigma factor (sigma-70 family)
MLSEEDLINECIMGNRLAEKQLYETYSHSFFGICLRYAKSREEAEDVLLTGFTSIFENLPSYKKEGSFEGWMKRIIINTAISNFRTNNKYYENTELNEETQNLTQYNDNQTYHKIEAKEIIKLIQQMPEGYQVIFNLHAIEGYKHTEIGKMLEISEGTSKSQYAKAKKWLQTRLK